MPPPRAIHRRRHRRALLAAAVLLPAPASSLATSYDLSSQTVDLTQTAYTAADILTLNATTLSAPAPFTLPAALHPTGNSTFDTPADLTLAGAIDGTRTLTKTGTAALVLAGDNASFGGILTVSSGTLRLASAAALGPLTGLRVNVLPTATLDLNGYSPTPFSHNLIANGGVIVNDNPASVSSMSGQAISRGATSNFILGGAGDINLTTVGMVSSGSLTKIGTGTLTFNFGNSLYGGVIVNAGTVRLGPGASFNTPSLTVNPGAAVDYNGFNAFGVAPTLNGGALLNNNTATPVTIDTFTAASPAITLGGAGNLTYYGTLSSSQSLTKVGAGTLTLIGGSTHTGGTTVRGGTVTIDSDTALGTPVSPLTLDGGALRAADRLNPSASGFVGLNRPVTVSPAGGTLDARYAIDFFSTLAGTGPLTKTGTATLYLPAPNKFSFTGPLTIDAGTVNLGFYDILKSNTVTINNVNPFGTSASNVVLGALAGTGTISSAAYTVGGNNASTTFAGTLSSVSLTKDGTGTLTLTGNSPGGIQTSTIYLNHGSLSLGDGSAATGPTRVAVYTSPSTTVLLNRPDSYTHAGGIVGGGIVVKLGPGTATLYGLNSLAGMTPASPVLDVRAGVLRLSTASPVACQITSLSISADASLDLVTRTLFINYPAAASPADTVRQYLLTSRLTSSAADALHRLAYVDSPSSLRIQLTLTGDANLDGKLNADDYALLDRSAAKSLPNPHWTDGDFNYDGTIDQNDYLLLDTAYLQQQGGTPSPAFLSQRESQFGPSYVSELLTSIPEPSAAAACLFAGLPLLPRRRRPD